MLTESLVSKGFVHTADGTGDIFHVSNIKEPLLTYSQGVAIGIPKGLTKVDRVVVHFHGFRGVCEPNSMGADGFIKEFQFLDQLQKIGATNTIVVLPMSLGKCETYPRLVAVFQQFRKWICECLGIASARWVISGHSGAYRPIGLLLHFDMNTLEFISSLEGVILMDATYTTQASWFEDFKTVAKINPKLKIMSVFREGGGTEEGSQTLLKNLPKDSVHIYKSITQSHCDVPKVYFGQLLKQITG